MIEKRRNMIYRHNVWQHIPIVARLTLRETEVMRLVALGKTAVQVADELGIAASTADNHRGRLMKKIGVKSSRELTILALRDGLIKFPERRAMTIIYKVRKKQPEPKSPADVALRMLRC